MRYWVLILAMLLAACGAKNDPIPALDDRAALEKVGKSLGEEDKKLFAGYLMRRTMAGAFGRPSTFSEKTVGEAITSQKEWLSKLSETEQKQAALKAEVTAKRQAAAAAIAQSVVVSAVDQKFFPSDPMNGRFQDQEEITFAIKNLSAKPIKAIKGNAIWTDSFGEEFVSGEARFEKPIAPGQTVTTKLYWDVNKFIDEQVKWTQLDGTQKFRFDSDHVVFGDGSKIEAPDAVD